MITISTQKVQATASTEDKATSAMACLGYFCACEDSFKEEFDSLNLEHLPAGEKERAAAELVKDSSSAGRDNWLPKDSRQIRKGDRQGNPRRSKCREKGA